MSAQDSIKLHRLSSSDVVREEEVERLLTVGLDEVEELGRRFAEDAADSEYATWRARLEEDEEYSQEERAADRAALQSLDRVAGEFDAREYVTARLRAYLTDTVTLLPEATGEVDRDKRDRALIQQALVRLKAPQLELILNDLGLVPGSSKAADLARQVAASYGWDPNAIARLVLDNTQEPEATTAGGPSTRVFEMKEPVEVAEARRAVTKYARRPIPVGPVRWFFFEVPPQDDSAELRLKGQLRTFRPELVDLDGTDARLGAEESLQDVELLLDGSTFVLAEKASSATAARAALRALEVLTRWRRLGWVRNAEQGSVAIPGRLHAQTEFVLGAVRSLVPPSVLGPRNALYAKFRSKNAEGTGSESNPDLGEVATISAWTGEGRHLLNTPSASKLMLSEGRPVTELVFAADVLDDAGQRMGTRVSTRIALDSDHVLVETGLTSAPDACMRAHRATYEAVTLAMSGALDEQGRGDLTEAIRTNEQSDGSNPSVLDPLPASVPGGSTN